MKEQKKYEIVFNDGTSLTIIQRAANSKFYVDPTSISDKTEEFFSSCLEIGAMKIQKLCEKLQEKLKLKIIDIK